MNLETYFCIPDPVESGPLVTEGPTSAFVCVTDGPPSTIGPEISKSVVGFAILNFI